MPTRASSGGEICQVDCIHPEAVAGTRAILQEPAVYRDLAALFGALADPTRARIVHALLHQELCSCDIAAVAGITKPGASQHLKVLRRLRLVKPRRAGKLVYYSLDDSHIALVLQVGLTHLGHGEPAPDGLTAVAAEEGIR